jgi:hypothetical protein
MPGIDWHGPQQEDLVRQLAAQPRIDFADFPTAGPYDYHAGNAMFSRLDAWMLQGMLRQLRPKRVIEVGCGWSSLVTARVNRKLLGNSVDFTCIDPYPPDFLRQSVDGISRLITQQVQDVPLDVFCEMRGGDVLFIDSTHTVKTGSDVVFLLEEVVPRLPKGAVIHFHDIFLPNDYPQGWVFAGRAWNEQYLVRGFLAFNHAFRVRLSAAWLDLHHRDLLAAVLPGYPESYRDGGASLWIERVSDGSAHVRPEA